MYITAVYRQYSLLKNLYNFLKWVFSVACYVGFASCKTFGKQPKHPCFGAEPPYRSSAICATASCSGFVWLTASILAWTRGGSPSNIAPARMPGVYAARLCTMQSQQSIHSPSPRGRGFRQGCRNKDTPSFARGKAIRVS